MAESFAGPSNFHQNIVIHNWHGEPSSTVEVVNSRENGAKIEETGNQNRRPIWTKESTYWLLEEMKLFEMREEKHQIKKRVVYEELAEKFTEANFSIHWEAIQKKWQNLMSTYWRHLKKPSKGAQWEYFSEMDSILRNTTVWVGLNGCKDPSQATSLHYNDQQDDRFWTTERILFLLEEMKHVDKEDDAKSRRNIFHKIAMNFHRLGVDIEWKVVQKKWHNLMSTYKRNLRKKRPEVVWEYFEAMNSVMNNYCSSSYNRLGIPESSFAPATPALTQSTGLDKDEDSLWTEDNILLLMEEMLVVKERRDKHLLKNRVVFREIADTLNAEGVQVDWKQVLKQWQSMYITYSKIIRGIMQASLWVHFERMHDIVGDCDMYVGVGAKKQCDDSANSIETVYQYITPDSYKTQFILSNSEGLKGDSFSDDQFIIFNADSGTIGSVGVKAEENSEVTAEYIVTCSPGIENKNNENNVNVVTEAISSNEAIISSKVPIEINTKLPDKFSFICAGKDSNLSELEPNLILGDDILEPTIVFDQKSQDEGEIILQMEDCNEDIEIECLEPLEDPDKELVTCVTDRSPQESSKELKYIKDGAGASGPSSLIVINNGIKKRKLASKLIKIP